MPMAAAPEETGLVEMDMAVDEAGQHGAATDDDLGRIGHDHGFNRGEPAAPDADVDRTLMAGEIGLAEDQVEGGVVWHRRGRSLACGSG